MASIGVLSLAFAFEAPYGEALFGHKEDGERLLGRHFASLRFFISAK
jgi:hypothetical protein